MPNRARDDAYGENGNRHRREENQGRPFRVGSDHRATTDGAQEAREENGMKAAPASALTETFATAIERGAALLGNNIRTAQDESMRFMTERLEHDMHTMERMARSRSLIELFTLQQKWLQGVASAYSQEFIRLSQIRGEAVQDAVSTTRRLSEMAQSEERFAAREEDRPRA